MKMKSILSFLFLGVVFNAFAGGNDNNYDVSLINAALLKDANAVKRYELIRFEIKDPGSAVYYYKKAITILNESGEYQADWVESYDDKFFIIKSVDATLYDSNGKKLRSLKKVDIGDFSAVGGSLASDNRVKHHNFNFKIYPYTVEYEVEIKRIGLLFTTNWQPVDNEGISVEKSIFEIVSPIDYHVRFKTFNYEKQPEISGTTDKIHHWEINNFLAIRKEAFSPSLEEITPTVYVAPSKFEIEGYNGEMDSWSSFGKFQVQLNKGRDILPENVKADVHLLTDGISDEKQKIYTLYKYLQSKTRYISIQLGIGGWQPLDASFVLNKGYGDCKALSNCMHSLLKEVGIKGYYTLIKCGDNKTFFLPDFPSRQSNHVIISVPLAKDTIWLECTDQNIAPGYLGGFTSNRYALMIKDEGGFLVHTPNYKMKDNLQVRNIKATLDESGKLTTAVVTNYKAIKQDDLFMFINTHTKKEQLEYLKKEIDIPNYDITSFDYKTTPSRLPVLTESLNIVAENYAQVSGKRIFIQPNILNKTSLQLKDEERQYDIDLPYEFSDIDSVEITLPNGYITESLPQPATVNSKFGAYKIDCKVVGNKVTMVRSFDKKSGRFPKADYKELVKFYSDMYKADRAKVVLVKKEG